MTIFIKGDQMQKIFQPIVFICIILAFMFAACAPAPATPTQAPAAPAAPAATTAPTVVPAKCDKLPNVPTAAAGELGSPDKPIVITYVPSGDTGKITKAGSAIADCLSKMTGLSFKIEVGTSFAASIEAMGANKAQIGFLNTFSVLLAEQKYGVIPVLASVRKYATNDVDPDKGDKDKLLPVYKGQFIAKKDSGIKSLADLKGKTFCFVDPNSTSGYIIPRILLKANGVDPDKDLKAAQNAGGHDKVAISVYNGDCDAGVTFIDVLTDSATNLAAKYPDIATKVAAFQDTEKIPNDGVHVTKDLDSKIKDSVVNGLLAMSQDPGGAAVLTSLYNVNKYQKIDANFYDDFAKLLKAAGVDPASLVK